MFPSELDVRIVPHNMYLLLTPFVYFKKNGGRVSVPKGFLTDFASVPIGLRWFVNGHGDTRKPAVIHDYLYSLAEGDRKDADKVFLEGLKDVGVSKWKRKIVYAAVRVGGWNAWRKYAKRNIKEKG